MSEEYTYLKDKFRRRRAEIQAEINRRFSYGMKPTDLMCATWYVKQSLERMRSDLDEHILCDNILSTREAKILYKYIDFLDDYMWNRLYDIAGKGVKN